ncbi:MAG: DUF177 domain-containing protein [Oligosphaeraceae bacterium]|nr:DUF177 domain-containing protein [Oligosphaeraceae bacterium]
MDVKSGLIFQLVDLRPEGVCLRGQISFADLDIQEEDRFSFPAALEYDLLLTPLGQNDVLLRGALQARIAIVCDRCNSHGELQLQVDDVCHQYKDAFGKILDLTPDIREDILIVFPQHFLCREDCRGLCLQCGEDLNAGSCACESAAGAQPAAAESRPDPWQGLDKLKLP